MENKNKKLMIVDDDKFLIDMYSIKFKKDGFDVDLETKGEEALEKLRDGFDPDIIILDVVMPGFDGVDLLEKIRQEKLASKAVVVMLTNQSQKLDIDRAKKFGFDGYIVKASTVPSEVVEKVMNIYYKNKK